MFDEFKAIFTNNLNQLLRAGITLYRTNIDGEKLWAEYLRAFPKGTDPFVKARTEHDCTACHHFIRQYGNLVFIHNYEIRSIWRIDAPAPYDVVTDRLRQLVESSSIQDIWATDMQKLGVDSNKAQDDGGLVITWQHLCGHVPNGHKQLMKKTKLGEYIGKYKTAKEIFGRTLQTITSEACEVVLELIAQNSLYRGAEFKTGVQTLLQIINEYNKIGAAQRDVWCWEKSYTNINVSHIKNSAIGTLLTNISNNMPLDDAVRQFELIVAPANYKRPKPAVTARMIEDAEKTITELGYESALARRHAKIEDISVNDVLFVNRATHKKLKQSTVLGLTPTKVKAAKAYGRIEEISIQDFMQKVLPNAQQVQILLEGRHANNIVNLTAPVHADAKLLFKWPNNFAWTYHGDVTDSIKENVRKAGGNVTGVLRFSIQWNEKGESTSTDYDAHALIPGNKKIDFYQRTDHQSHGSLDVDIRRPNGRVAVENIVWPTLSRMSDGEYRFYVHHYSSYNAPKGGFKAQIEMNGEIFEYEYPTPLKHGEIVEVATVTLANRQFTIKHHIDSQTMSREVCGVDTNTWIDVPIICYSPNYWGDSRVGNQHIFFMLEGANNPNEIRSIFNEYLHDDLARHKRVFELLGTKSTIPADADQLCGVGFSLTKRDNVVVRTMGAVQSDHKVIF